MDKRQRRYNAADKLPCHCHSASLNASYPDLITYLLPEKQKKKKQGRTCHNKNPARAAERAPVWQTHKNQHLMNHFPGKITVASRS